MIKFRGWLILLLSILSYIGARAFGSYEFLLLSITFLITFLYSLFSTIQLRDKLFIKRKIGHKRVHVDNVVDVNLHAKNKGTLFTSIPIIKDKLPSYFGDSHNFVVPTNFYKKDFDIKYKLNMDKRGLYKIGPITMRGQDSFNLTQSNVLFDDYQEILVYPKTYDISQFSPGGVGFIGYEALTSDLVSPIGDDFYSLREYVSGDDLRKIHWKSTAKTSALMIRKVDDATISRVAIIVDGFRDSHLGEGKESTFEYLISAAATIVNYFAKSNYRVRIVVSGNRLYVIPFDDASRNYHRIMEVFAKCEPSGNISPTIIISKELDSLPTGSNIIFLTTSFNTDWLDKLKRIRRRGQMRIALVLVVGETFLPMSDVLYQQKMTMFSEFLAKIYGSGISVCLLRKGCNIKSTLEGIKRNRVK